MTDTQDITIGIVSYFSTDLLQNLIPNLCDQAVAKDLKFLICDNTNGEDSVLYETLGHRYEIIPFKAQNPRTRSREKASGSYSHALGLNFLLSRITTKYGLFIDPDVLLLSKGWDVICGSSLSEITIAVGTPHHSRKIIKYHNFPSPIFIFFDCDAFRSIGADWTPYTDSTIQYYWDQILRIVAITGSWIGEAVFGQNFYASWVANFMRTLFGNSSKDTGWKLPLLARRYGFTSHLFQPVITHHQLLPQFSGNSEILELMRKFELFAYQGIPFAAHFHGTRHRYDKGKQQTLQRWRELSFSVASACADFPLDKIVVNGCLR